MKKALTVLTGMLASSVLSLAVKSAAAQTAAVPAPSCGDAGKELEIPFELDWPKAAAPIRLAYAECIRGRRGDLLPPYIDRLYRGTDGFGLLIATDEGRNVSEILLAKGMAVVVRFGALDNRAIASGMPLKAGGCTLRAVKPAAPPAEHAQD